MAQRGRKKVPATQEKIDRPVRLDLTATDRERLEKQARRRGLSMAAYVRMILLANLEAEESPEK